MLTTGDGAATADAGAAAVRGAADGLSEGLAVLAGVADAFTACVSAARVAASVEPDCEPLMATSRTLTAVQAHRTTAAAAMDIPGWARMLAQLTCRRA